jgi:hypothetical protein
MKQKLALVPICDEHQAPPAAMHETAAARVKTSTCGLISAGFDGAYLDKFLHKSGQF